MGTTGRATEWTSQKILDKVKKEKEPEFNDVFYEILNELKKINAHLSILTDNEIGDKDAD